MKTQTKNRFLFLFCAILCFGAPMQTQATQTAQAVLNAYSILPTSSALENQPSFDALLAGYTAENTSIQLLEVAVQKALIALQQAQLKGAPNLNLSTGNMGVTFSDKANTFSASPKATVTLPSLANAAVTAEAPVTVTAVDGKDSEVSWSGAGVMISADIISAAKKSQDVAVKKAYRDVTTAKRNYEAEKTRQKRQFLADVKNLYSKASAVIAAKNDVYDKQLTFDTLKAQGYAASSASYRTAVINLNDAQHKETETTRAYTSALRAFSAACGVNLTALPIDVPSEALLNAQDFSRGDYAGLEDVYWTHEYNNQVRDAKTDFTLSTGAGYKYLETPGINSTDGTHNITANVSAQYKSMNVTAGVSAPVDDIDKPTFSLSLGWDLNSGKQKELEKRSSELDIQTELLNIRKKEDAYTNDMESAALTRENLEWSKQQNENSVKLYRDFLNETKGWYQQGLIPKSQVVSAERNYTGAVVNEITGRLDRLIYNIDTRLLFIADVPE